MAKKAKKINPNGIQLFGPVPRTVGTLITVLVVTSSFGLIGWHQLQSSKAQSVSTTATSSNYASVPASNYTVTTSSTQTNNPTYPSNFRSRVMFLGGLIIATVALLLILKLWT